jgi:D-alanyl-D-alanine carboxypeptidase (penicillin-binding protein 5/6)
VLNVKPALGLAAGDSVKVLDLFNAMLIGSNNDAALALADYTQSISGADFIALMNREAQALGMDDSHFSNPMGFDSPSNYSTASDIKQLIIASQPLAAFKDLGRSMSYSFFSAEGKHFSTVATNKLLQNHPEIEAIKTGFTENARGAMASKLTVGSHKIVIIVLDSGDREADTLKLEAQILNDFKWD